MTLLAEGTRLTRFSLNVSLSGRLSSFVFGVGRPDDGRVRYLAGKYPVLPMDNGTIMSEPASDPYSVLMLLAGLFSIVSDFIAEFALSLT